MYELIFTLESDRQLRRLDESPAFKAETKQIKKALGYLMTNPRHPGLRTHPYRSLESPYHPAEKVFEAYAQNNTPGAYRIFWCYGPRKKQITVLAITPHP